MSYKYIFAILPLTLEAAIDSEIKFVLSIIKCQSLHMTLRLGKTIKVNKIRDTLNLSTDADSSTDTKTDRKGQRTFFFLFQMLKKIS